MHSNDEQSLRSDDEGTAEENSALMGEKDPAALFRIETRKGSSLGSERVRIVHPSRRAFRRLGTGVLEATKQAYAPGRGFSHLFYNLKRMLVGAPLATAQAEHERLTKFKALAIFGANPISSIAYATEAVLLVLIVAGSSSLWSVLPISLAIVGLLTIVALSYRRIIPAYPNGGGSYIIVKDNLGTLPGLVAAAAVLIDYTLTASVSIAAAVQNLASLFSVLAPGVVLIDVGLIILITILNIRGLRESRTLFSLPTYLFIAGVLILIIIGCIKSFFIQHQPLIGHFQSVTAAEPLTIFLILKTFAVGCSAMTGIEFFPNSVPALKKPETRNAATTLAWMAGVLGILFLGITLLALSYHIEPKANGYPTVIAQLASQVFTGPLFFMYPVFQFAILLILLFVVYFSYSDFPRLASLLARDDFFPHQFAFRGDRLAFSIGIMFLAACSSLLLIGFRGDITPLVNVYTIGVFLALTLTQGAMIRHWWRLRREHKGWQRSLTLNGLGALITSVIASVLFFTRFLRGAWVLAVFIPLLVYIFLAIHRHYMRVERERTIGIPIRPKDIRHRIIVPIARLDQATTQSLAYARSISSHVIAVHVAVDMHDAEGVRSYWERWQKQLAEDEEMHLIIIESPYRSLTGPLLAYIDTVHELFPDDTLTVILPELIVAHWWERLLHNQTVLRLKVALAFRPDIVSLSIAQHMRRRHGQSI